MKDQLIPHVIGDLYRGEMEDCDLDVMELPDPRLKLMDHQIEVLNFLGEGKVLYGGVGSGKSAVAMAYYIDAQAPKDVYVITTAKKRDSQDWLVEAARFGVGTDYYGTVAGVLTVDSWQNIGDYIDIKDAFFIFDEQRVVGHGAWVKSFLKIAKRNSWIMLSATPGDVWLDYAPLFIANGWYNNITDFKRQHVIYAPYVKFPKVLRYVGEGKLIKYRNKILVEMPYLSDTERIVNYLEVDYDNELVDWVIKKRWEPFKNRPLKDVGELFRLLRYIVYSDPSRVDTILYLMKAHPKLIIFYNFDFELEILRGLADFGIPVGEWNGHKKTPIPDTDNWVYLVQYMSGSEGWNCIETDSMVLYSLTYSYKQFVQAQGRTDRLDSPHKQLYYYILDSGSLIDTAVRKALEQKKSFNERGSDLFRRFSKGKGVSVLR